MNDLAIRFKNILMVDDDHDDCYIFEEALKELTNNVHFSCLTNSEVLMQHLAQHKPELIFLDINMPKKNGFECLEEIRSNADYNGITVIMYSNSTRDHEVEMAFSKGASLFIKKPTAHSDLVEVLKNVLQNEWNGNGVRTSRFLFDARHYRR